MQPAEQRRSTGARKKNGEARFCVDYRRLNAVTKKDVYSLPRIDDSLNRLAGAKFFSSLDLKSGYWQVPVTKEDQEKTSFATLDGLFEFIKMPFGLVNTPATFQRLMNDLLAAHKWRDCLVYLDDVLVFGVTLEEHSKRLEAVLKKVQTAGLKLNLKKSFFAKTEMTFL